jgi:hypothetical protein
LSPRDYVDSISGMCADGKHGRCTGWMVVPHYGDYHGDPDISIQCTCVACKHPPVDPYRHLTERRSPRKTRWNSK